MKRVRSSVQNSIAVLAFALPKHEARELSEAEAEAQGYMRLAHAALEAQQKKIDEKQDELDDLETSWLETSEQLGE